MNVICKMLNLQVMLFALMLVGIGIKKAGILTKENRKSFSNLLINVVLPCNIVNSFMGDSRISPEFLTNCILAMFFSVLIQIVVVFLNRILFRRVKSKRKNVMAYGMVCSNSSFIGLPVAEELYGNLGVLYTSIFQIPVRFTMWTSGLALFTEVDRKSAIKKLIKHPCIIAIFIGFAFLLLPVSIPGVITNTISVISKCTTPLSMFVIGAILADADKKTMFSKDVLYFTFFRLLGFPLLIWMVLSLFSLDSLLVSICVIMSGMPAGSTTSILADQYDGDFVFASQITFVSTLLSVITIPVLGVIVSG